MPGDELHEEAGGPVKAVPDAGQARAGGRHAAPRKPLLNRLHVPAGKAIALAAMPSAVLMGMGLTPQLANAKPLPKNPFKPGPCVSQEDRDEAKEKKEQEERERQQKADQEKAEKVLREAKEKKRKAEAEKAEQAEKEAGAQKSDGSGSSGSSADSGSSSGTSDSSGTDTQDSSGSGDTAEKKNPLDPLGLGDALHDAFTPEEKKQQEQAEEEKAAQEQDSAPDSDSTASSGSSDSGDAEDGVGGAVGDTVNKVGDGVKDTTDKLGRTAGDAAKGVGDEVGKTKDKLPVAGDNGSADAGGKKAFPCVEEKKTDGKDEQTPVTLPNDPFELQSSKLALHGLNYEGVRNVTTANGAKKQVLKFTADSLDIGDLHQIVQGPGGTKYHVRAAEGSNSTIRGGKVTMYTERLEGNLFGLIPIVFDPEHPPPLNVPEAMFTKVKVTQAGQFGGNLTVPGLHQTISK